MTTFSVGEHSLIASPQPLFFASFVLPWSANLERLGFPRSSSNMSSVMETDLKAFLEPNGVSEADILWMTQSGVSTTSKFAKWVETKSALDDEIL